jgi:hypothetical protein
MRTPLVQSLIIAYALNVTMFCRVGLGWGVPRSGGSHGVESSLGVDLFAEGFFVGHCGSPNVSEFLQEVRDHVVEPFLRGLSLGCAE